MTEDLLDRMLEAMPKIAEVVNSFENPDVQVRAFDALMRPFGSITTDPVPDPAEPPTGEAGGAGSDDVRVPKPRRVGTAKSNGGTPRKAAKTAWSPTKDLNFWPTGKKSITDFAAEKQPSTNPERSTALLYWFQEIAENVNPGDILAGYRECNWALPNNIANQLEVTASTKGWLISKNKTDLQLTPSGDNQVRINMPGKKK